MDCCKWCDTPLSEMERSRGLQCYTCANGRQRYNLNRKEQLTLLALQNNRCAFCDVEIELFQGTGNSGCIDHDHETGVVRGILCGKCNTVIGKVEKNWNIDEFAEKLNVYRRRGELAT